jgi:hypothetical protein
MSSPVRWRVIKTIFARSLPVSKRHKDVRKRDRERGVRQQRFWEYFLLHDKTFAAYVDSCLLQSGKHRYLAYVADWPHSTFQAGAAFTLKAGSHHWNMPCLPRTSASKRVRRVYLYPGYALRAHNLCRPQKVPRRTARERRPRTSTWKSHRSKRHQE